MNYRAKCGQSLPKARFRIVNGPARRLFIWPALDIFGYALIPRGSELLPGLHGSALAVGAVLVAAVYAWIALSGR
jgi:hypothetical protein